MKQRELCKRHGLSAAGSKPDLAARFTAIPSPEQGGAPRAKGVVGVVVGKGCLKRSGGGCSGVPKKVTFALEEEAEEEIEMGTRRRRTRVKCSQVAANTRERQRKMLTATEDGDVAAAAAPNTRHLRNRVVQINDNVVRKTQISKKPENKRKSCRPSTQRHQQLASSLEEEAEQIVPAPCVVPQLRRSARSHSNRLVVN
ncbi:hypothetical protein GUJ93_ZPchr0012g19626 [Zizania palustris]|uniref:SAP domain-containing protein n=1 Tax=Zizania palustris TaxID=103762 RepID=A0A8J5WR95_ZIZPA|nr:hypothetical protein GUJ93_ZPchr0012g19626 [Zizania palustris]